ncbi:MAG: hypothetical protein PVJ19_15310 [Desulfobacteraceae bacterium]|jgi:hypothetical protein
MGHGEYFRVSQSGSAVLYKTPYDKKIADLSRALDGTRIYYGSPEAIEKMEERWKTADEIYSVAEPSAVAKRTIFNSKCKNLQVYSDPGGAERYCLYRRAGIL